MSKNCHLKQLCFTVHVEREIRPAFQEKNKIVHMCIECLFILMASIAPERMKNLWGLHLSPRINTDCIVLRCIAFCVQK